MSNHKNLRAILKKMSGQDNVVTIPRIFVDYLDGDLTTALVLNQLVFFSDKTKRKDGYFFKTYNEWEEETGLSKRRVKYSIDKLAKLELVQTKRKKAYGAPTVHYALDYDKMLDSIMTKCMVSSEQNVTNPESDKVSQSLTDDLQMNTTDEEEDEDKQRFAQVFDFYENNFGGTHGEVVTKFIDEWVPYYPAAIINEALAIAKDNFAKKPPHYAHTILKDWHFYKLNTLEEVRAFRAKKNESQGGNAKQNSSDLFSELRSEQS